MTTTSDCGRDFTIEPGIRPEHIDAAAAGYWDAFSRKLRYPLGPRSKAMQFLQSVIDPSHAISAVASNGQFLGVAGFKTPAGAFVGGDLQDMVRSYGWFSGIARGALVSVLERKCEENALLMDGIFVEPAARGLGVGSALLGAIERHAAEQGLKQVRLDVIDENPRAQALYSRVGFVPRDTMSLGPLRHVFGFRSATTMTKAVR